MLRPIASACLLILLFFQPASAADVCRNEYFQGMKAHKDRATSVLPHEVTRDVSKAQVYVEFDGEVLYYHSNFVSEGKDEDGKAFFPTKVKGAPGPNSPFSDARAVFNNIVFTKPPGSAQTAIIDKALLESVQFHLDISVFDPDGRPRIDVTGIRNLRIVDGKIGQTIGAQPEILFTSLPPPSLIAKLKGCCLFGRPPHAVPKLLNALSAQPFKAADVKFASLFIDSGTEAAVRNNPHVRQTRLGGDGEKLRSKEDFSKLMAEAKGATLIMIGHVEGRDYVIRDSGKQETFRIAIADARNLARLNGVELIDIGCETTRAIREASFGFGVMTKYNSVDAIHSINRALTNAKTVQDFLVSLTSEGLKVVVEPSFVGNLPEKRASIYSRTRDKAKVLWAKVATITFTGF